MYIKEITAYTIDLEHTVIEFLKQLVNGIPVMTGSLLQKLIHSDNSHLFCAVDSEGHYIGMVTVGIYLAPTGRKAWVEDVVVSKESRGLGVGEALTRHAIQFAKEQGADSLMLTSNPSRIVANQLYRKIGFEQRETNVYRMML